MIRHLAACLLSLGCSDILGIPDDPHVVVPADASAPTSAQPVERARRDAGAGVVSGGANSETPHITRASTPGPEPLPSRADPSDAGEVASIPADAGVAPSVGTVPAQSDPSVCVPVTRPLVSDFTFTPGTNPTNGRFGADAAFQGGTFRYPVSDGFTSSVTDDDWHLTGRVVAVAGFGLYSSPCISLDASAFGGISFTLWGSVEGDQPVTFVVESAAQQVSSDWVNTHKTNPSDADVPPNIGRCTPDAARYDGSCRGPRIMLSVPATPTTVVLPWSDFVDGRPVPGLDSREITSIAWALPAPNANGYGVDIHIDNLQFIAP